MLTSGPRRLNYGEARAYSMPIMQRRNGYSYTADEPNNVDREDSELWNEDGSCLIYMHGKGQCNENPSFRIDFMALTKARCYKFIEKYIDRNGRRFDLPKDDVGWSRLCPKRTVSLYVPFEPGSTRQEMAQQYRGIRNLLAWTLGLPLAGEHLGGEIMTLFRNMVISRPGDADCMGDILSYLDLVGYLEFAGQPRHALAVLYAAEFLKHEDLYARAFVHCIGMGERIFTCSEYTEISLASKRLMRKARESLEAQRQEAVEKISSFLDEELSESRLGLPSGVRAHLDHFRSALFTFYSTKFGYFPPRNFDAKIVQTMSEDFESLYELLVDDGAGTPGMISGNNGGGLCILQIIRSFDSWNSYQTRRHPLPLLPTASEACKKRRMPWLSRSMRGKPSDKLVAHAALIKASNWRESCFGNDLVRMYRDFEGQSLQPPTNKMDKQDSVSMTDARKVRWILIYAMSQVLRSILQRAPQVQGEEAPYFLTASIAELPPWKTTLDTAVCSSGSGMLPMTSSSPADEPWQPKNPMGLEIKPDIDYFALTHNEQPKRLSRRQSLPSFRGVVSPRTQSLSRSASRKAPVRRSTIRNSISRRLRPGAASHRSAAASPTSATAKNSYHEIVVHGYGNGTKEMTLERRNTVSCYDSGVASAWVSDTMRLLDTRLPNIMSPVLPVPAAMCSTPPGWGSSPNRSNSKTSSIETAESLSQGVSSQASPVTITCPEFESQCMEEPIIVRNSSHKSLTQRYSVRSVLDTFSRTSSFRRKGGLVVGSCNTGGWGGGGKETVLLFSQPAFDQQLQLQPQQPQQQQQQQQVASGGVLSRGPSLRKSLLLPESWTLTGRTTSEDDIDEEEELVTLQAEADEWTAMQAFLEDDVEAKPAWEQYHDLGGLTEIR